MEHSQLIFIKDLVVGFCAVIGMVLGIKNYLNDRKKDRVNLKITPKAVKTKGKGPNGQSLFIVSESEFDIETSANLFAIEIVNLSAFPLVISEVGLMSQATMDKMIIPFPLITGEGKLPHKLTERDSITIYGSLDDIAQSQLIGTLNLAYVKTACGHTESSTSVALLSLNQQLAEYA
ncbi:hypothetical protein J7288_004566 [Vibrio parahaemolyticus]|nr:hypothetical protein [Vibrio parahaemolyticus]